MISCRNFFPEGKVFSMALVSIRVQRKRREDVETIARSSISIRTFSEAVPQQHFRPLLLTEITNYFLFTRSRSNCFETCCISISFIINLGPRRLRRRWIG